MSTLERKIVQSGGLKRMKEIAAKAMKQGEFSVVDVKKELKKMRSENK